MKVHTSLSSSLNQMKRKEDESKLVTLSHQLAVAVAVEL